MVVGGEGGGHRAAIIYKVSSPKKRARAGLEVTFFLGIGF